MAFSPFLLAALSVFRLSPMRTLLNPAAFNSAKPLGRASNIPIGKNDVRWLGGSTRIDFGIVLDVLLPSSTRNDLMSECATSSTPRKDLMFQYHSPSGSCRRSRTPNFPGLMSSMTVGFRRAGEVDNLIFSRNTNSLGVNDHVKVGRPLGTVFFSAGWRFVKANSRSFT